MEISSFLKTYLLDYNYKFAKINYKPGMKILFPYLIYSLFKGRKYRTGLIRSFRASRISSLGLQFNNSIIYPKIELIINSIEKDFIHLNSVITRGVLNSLNTVEKITLVVPSTQVAVCKQVVSKNRYAKIIKVKSEDKILNFHTREKIKKYFPDRYGWVLQQFLTIEQVIKSKSKGVLQINSDTVILRPILWVDESENQPIFVSSEYHLPYYELLNKINNCFPVETNSHITHHMIFQPKFLKQILAKSKLYSIEHLLDSVIKNYDKNTLSPMCIEFELYALGMQIYFPDKIKITKFSNVNFKILDSDLENSFNNLSKKYNSVSFHSYL